MEIEDGSQQGPYIVLRDAAEGRRHAIRPNSIMGIHELEDGRTMLSLSGAKIILLDEDFDAAVSRLADYGPPSRPRVR
ncbi:hypothetical protein [Azospirillum soli]|uniref:hypothetical protein n=1 Tax=Azospirillum soli TaxID=1304799 RepID=UPI001AE6D1A6|nr:hypothetical protein [Azospirillum soli]MBP2315527.1 hypothetical protein [Azospirillum soli]